MDQGMSTILMMVVLFAIMYFMMIRPEKKRKQKAEEMRNSLKKGDSVTTIGGIVGKVVSVGQDSFVIETSDDRVRIEFAKWALSTNESQPADNGKKKKDEPADEVPEEPAEEAAEEVSVAEEAAE